MGYGDVAGRRSRLSSEIRRRQIDEERSARQSCRFAGSEKNWELAAYELDELQEGFDDAIKYYPTKDELPIAQMVKDITPGPMGELKSAVEAKDKAKFAKAFDKLTAACNTCHQGSKHAFIVIRRPTASPYSNQSFIPAKQR